MNITLTDKQIIMRRNGDYSEAQSVVPANISQDTPDDGFHYDISVLVKLFQVIEGKVRMEFDARAFLLVKTRSEVYFQAPMRVPAKKAQPANKDKAAKGGEEMKQAA